MSRVLIVDDEEDIRFVLRQVLERGHDLRLEADGNAAVRCLDDFSPDLVITDLHMPGASGLEVLDAAHDRDPLLPVMIITGSGTLDTAVEALRRGAYDYIVKPFDDLGAIRNTVERALESRDLRRENQRLVEDLRAANAFKGQLLRTVSHDFKNLLTVVIGYGRLAQMAPDSSAESLDHIMAASRQMALMSEDLAVYGHFDANSLHLDCDRTSLLECARNAMDSVLVDPSRHRLVLPERDVQVWADPQRTTQILTNLVGNAVKYSPQGGDVTIAFHENAQEVSVSVSDQGLGVPADKMDRLFDAFFRLERDAGGNTPGTGLGLTIVRMLVELQGGRIRCESREGSGSTFHFTLPRVGA